MRLKNKIAIITGASRGVGKATALLFAKEGAKIVVNYFSAEEKAKEVVSQILELGSEAIAVKCDVSNEDEVKNMIDQAVKKFGKVDILVNNAGIVFDATFAERTIDQWKKTFDTNVLGVFLCSRLASEPMKKNNHGKIINVSSTSGMNSFSTESMDYDASKAAVVALTRDLAKELAPSIQVNSVAPGWIDTDMNVDLPEDYLKEEMEKIYLKRMAKPEEIAKAILFFASDDSDYVTGSTLVVDGGHD
ncbi:glucose 1-dehydrogenase [Patescibacteria group bacterium]|nr:glucose 1-dehydrogenase [Patescibacteria group bacterium]